MKKTKLLTYKVPCTPTKTREIHQSGKKKKLECKRLYNKYMKKSSTFPLVKNTDLKFQWKMPFIFQNQIDKD